MRKLSWLFYGPPGCGKSTWIENQARTAGAQLYHWNARADRTLREGRETLHQQVRSQNLIYVWIEGADDLTPEAQAFLRRILETASPNVQCILECRDPSKISPAIQSRCEWKQAAASSSFRKLEQKGVGAVGTGGAGGSLTHTPFTPSSTINQLYKSAVNPVECIQEFFTPSEMSNPNGLWKQALLSLRAVGGGSSAWAHLAYLKALSAFKESNITSAKSVDL